MTWLRNTAPAIEAVRHRAAECREVVAASFGPPARVPEVQLRVARLGCAMGERTVRRYLGMLCDAGRLEKYEGMYRRKR